MLSGNGFLIGLKLKGALESIKTMNDQTYLIELPEESVLGFYYSYNAGNVCHPNYSIDFYKVNGCT